MFPLGQIPNIMSNEEMIKVKDETINNKPEKLLSLTKCIPEEGELFFDAV